MVVWEKPILYSPMEFNERHIVLGSIGVGHYLVSWNYRGRSLSCIWHYRGRSLFVLGKIVVGHYFILGKTHGVIGKKPF